MKSSIFYHEDDYRQIELIPQENYFKTHRDITDNGLANTAEYGFLSIIEREEHKIKIDNLKIHINSVKHDLSPFTVKYFEEVTTGYGISIKIKHNTVAFGFERFALFFEFSHTGIIKNIWMCPSALLPKLNTCAKLYNSLIILGNNYNLILVDWNEEIVFRLSNVKAVQRYLEENFDFNFPSQ